MQIRHRVHGRLALVDPNTGRLAISTSRGWRVVEVGDEAASYVGRAGEDVDVRGIILRPGDGQRIGQEPAGG